MPIRSHDPFDDLLTKIDPRRNPYAQKLIDGQNSRSLPIAFGPDLKLFPGHWREQLKERLPESNVSPSSPLIVEIGCHYGHTLVDLAADHPECLFIGVDITFKRVVQSAQRALDLGLKNIFVILANAGGLHELFCAEEVNGFVTFFPDPWTKTKHAENRLYAPKFCNAAREKLCDEGFLWLKTDQQPYYTNACEHAAAAGFSETVSLPVFGTKDYSSAFMRRYELLGLPWYGRKWVKSSSRSTAH